MQRQQQTIENGFGPSDLRYWKMAGWSASKVRFRISPNDIRIDCLLWQAKRGTAPSWKAPPFLCWSSAYGMDRCVTETVGPKSSFVSVSNRPVEQEPFSSTRTPPIGTSFWKNSSGMAISTIMNCLSSIGRARHTGHSYPHRLWISKTNRPFLSVSTTSML